MTLLGMFLCHSIEATKQRPCHEIILSIVYGFPSGLNYVQLKRFLRRVERLNSGNYDSWLCVEFVVKPLQCN